MATHATRKPVDELTLADLEAWAVWEFAEDEEDVEGRDETWVRPSPDTSLLPRISPYAVRAQFTTATGTSLIGVAWVTTTGGLEVDSISLFPNGAYTCVLTKEHGLEGDTRQKLATAGIFFPLSFKLSAGAADGTAPFEGLFD